LTESAFIEGMAENKPQTLVRLKRTIKLTTGQTLVKSPPGDGWHPVEVREDRYFSEYGPEISAQDIAEIRVSEHWNEE
jgi:hypothetical protein